MLADKGTKVHSISHHASVLEATRKMNQHRIGALVVMEDDRVAGIFTERDVLMRVIGEGASPADISVGQVMTRDVVCCSPDTSLEEISEIMHAKRIRHVPVCDEEGNLLGMVSIGDVNAHHAHHQQATIHYLNEYIYGRV